MVTELMMQRSITSLNVSGTTISRKKAGWGAKFFLAPCFCGRVCTISWEQRKFGELVVIERGGSPRPIDDYITDSTDGLNWVKIGDAPEQGNYITSTKEKIRPEGLSKTREVHPGDLILSNSMSFGKPYIMAIDGCIHDGWLSIKNTKNIFDLKFLCVLLGTDQMLTQYKSMAAGSTVNNLNKELVGNTTVTYPNVEEQRTIGKFFEKIDNLITLHQREPPKEDKKILNDINTDTLFYEYYNQWLVIYKEGSVRLVTMHKYYLTAAWIKRLIPTVRLCDFDRITYQQLINDYAELHERQTTMDFHHQLKGAILDAVDDGLIARDPTRKVIIKGKTPNDKKKKYLSRYELQKLLADLDLKSGLNMDWLILLIAKTGMRFSEAIAVTPADFDFTHQTLSVNKTWDYKGEGGFQPTKNRSSVRKIRLDWQTVGQFYAIVRELNENAPFFVSKEKKIYNSTLNDVLERHCKAAGIPVISVHGLRHTHASLLLFDGVSIASVAQRLGHSSINTTQKTYLHIIRELENKDIDLIMKSISSLLD